MIVKTVDEVWPTVDTFDRGVIDQTQLIELARIGLEKAELKELFNKDTLKKLLKDQESFTKKEVAEKIDEFVQ